MASLDALAKETRAALIIAKSDGELTTGEVLQIAVQLAHKIHGVTSLSATDKKSLLLHILKKGLDDSGGLDFIPGYAGSTNEVKAAFEAHLLETASATVDILVSAFSGGIDFKKPSTWASLFSRCISAAKALAPKDQALLNSAINYTSSLVNKVEDTTKAADVEMSLPGSSTSD